jgi:hypothetical protein
MVRRWRLIGHFPILYNPSFTLTRAGCVLTGGAGVRRLAGGGGGRARVRGAQQHRGGGTWWRRAGGATHQPGHGALPHAAAGASPTPPPNQPHPNTLPALSKVDTYAPHFSDNTS